MSVRQQISRAFARGAVDYDRIGRVQQDIANRLLSRLEFLRVGSDWLLDLGCGTGACGQHLTQRFSKARIVNLDIAPAMLTLAEKKLASQNSFFLNADIHQLPLASHQFDCVVSNFTLQWSDDLGAVFKEVYRVLRPGGVFLFSLPGPDTLHELADAYAAVDRFSHVNGFYDMHDVGDALHTLGFSDPVLDREDVVYGVSSVKTLLQELKALGSTLTLPEKRKGLMTLGSLKKISQAYEKYRNDAGTLPVTYEVIYGVAWVPESKLTRATSDNMGRVVMDLDTLRGQLKD